MSSNTLLLKNMVCQRCIMVAEDILRKAAVPFQLVTFGEIHLEHELTIEQKLRLTADFASVGFELIDNRSTALVEKLKQYIIKRARCEVPEKESKIKLSKYLSGKVNHEYTYLSSLFSSVEGRTIENYFIEQRIEKAKELLVYGQLTMSQIAFDLEYSSTSHLSAQFKKVTGLTPSYFKEIGTSRRKSLDKI